MNKLKFLLKTLIILILVFVISFSAVAFATTVYQSMSCDIYMTAEKYQASGVVNISNKGTELSFYANALDIHNFDLNGDCSLTLPVEFNLINNNSISAFVEFEPKVISGNVELLDNIIVSVNNKKVNEYNGLDNVLCNAFEVKAGVTENIKMDIKLQIIPFVDITPDNNELAFKLLFEASNGVTNRSIVYLILILMGLLLVSLLVKKVLYLKQKEDTATPQNVAAIVK